MGFIHVKIHTHALQRGYLKFLECQQFCLTSHNAKAEQGAEATEQNSVSIQETKCRGGKPSDLFCLSSANLAHPWGNMDYLGGETE